MSTRTPEGPEDPAYPYRRRHRTEHEAVSRLRDFGYAVIRTDGRFPGVNLIAMKGDRFRFVCVRRRKGPAGTIAGVAAAYAEDLHEIRRYISSIVTSELWIWCRQDGWRYFAVYPGRIQEMGGDDGRRL